MESVYPIARTVVMNDKVTISLLQLFKMFPDQDSARDYLESRRWPEGQEYVTLLSD